jgi:hypothetical protein
MAKKRGWLLRLLLLVAVLIAAAIAIAPFVPLGPLKPAVESRLSSTLGRKVTVGSLRLSLLGGPYVLIDSMTAEEDTAFGQGSFLKADQVRANLALMPLILRRQVVLDGLRIKSADLTFIKNNQGVWSWTTLGQSGADTPVAYDAAFSYARQWASTTLAALFAQVQTSTALDSINIEGASVRLVDSSGAQQPPESLYKNVALRATVTRPTASSSQAVGELRVESSEEDGAELLKADIPFDITIDRNLSPKLSARGVLGPGRLQSKNFDAEGFKSAVNLNGSTVTLDQMELSLYEGTMRGRLDLDLATQRFTADAQVENLNLDQALASKLQIPGQITGHITAQFKLGGQLLGFQQSIPTINGTGHMSSSDMFIASVNISEQVARALQIEHIGDMNPGTNIGHIESEFQLDQGTVRTNNLRIQQMDGLGDATASQGWFKVASPPTLNYAATLVLNSEATARVKSASTLIGIAVTILESNNQVAIPVNITDQVSNPQVQVDVSRLF